MKTKYFLINILKFNNYLVFIFLTCILFSCGEIKSVSTFGTHFGNSSMLLPPNMSKVDFVLVTVKEKDQAFKNYRKNIRKCNPKWLIQYDYSGKKLVEGYAVRCAFSHHHYWLAEKITYAENCDTLSHEVNPRINVKYLKYFPVFITRFIAKIDGID